MKRPAVTIAALVLAALGFCAAAAASPGDVLYDQYDHAGPIGAGSQDFEAALDPYDDVAADDFDVPAGPGWNVTGVEVQGTYFNGSGPATSVNVTVYANSGDLPGTLLASRPNQSFTGDPSFVITLDPSIGLFEGRHGSRCRRTRCSRPQGSGPGRTGPESDLCRGLAEPRRRPGYELCQLGSPRAVHRGRSGTRPGVPAHRDDRRTSAASSSTTTTSAATPASTSTTSTSASASTSTSATAPATVAASQVPRAPRDRAEARQGEGEDPLEALRGRRRPPSSRSLESRRTGDRAEPACRGRPPRGRPSEPHRRPPLAARRRFDEGADAPIVRSR